MEKEVISIISLLIGFSLSMVKDFFLRKQKRSIKKMN